MNPAQGLRIASAFARAATRSSGSSLCGACVDVLAVTGAAITVMSGIQSGPVCVSDPAVAALEDLQFSLGDGPCQDAYRTERPVLTGDLDRQASGRWPAFVALARTSGIGGVFAYPMIARQAKVGVLTLYQRVGGDLSATQHQDGLALAEVLTETVLSLQGAAPPGTLAAGLDDAVVYRAEIYQASGIVAVQLGVPAADALLRIRAYAFAHDRPVAAVAAAIVAHRLRLTDDRTPTGEGA